MSDNKEERTFYKVEMMRLADHTPCACGSCDWKGPFNALREIEETILTPGDPSPAGRCPEEDCQALVYPETA